MTEEEIAGVLEADRDAVGLILQIRKICAKRFDRARGIGVASNLEWIFALQFKRAKRADKMAARSP